MAIFKAIIACNKIVNGSISRIECAAVFALATLIAFGILESMDISHDLIVSRVRQTVHLRRSVHLAAFHL